MTTKTEERLKKLLDDNLNAHIDVVNQKVSGMFFYGMMSGIILSYSGLLGYISGIGTGILIATQYKYISYQITENAGTIFQTILNKIKTDI